MRDCVYRFSIGDVTKVGCTNSHDLVHSGTVPVEFCNKCSYANDGSKPVHNITEVVNKPCSDCRGTTINHIIERDKRYPDVVVDRIEKPKNRDWSVVVTTSPRHEPTIESCIQSLVHTGWEPVVFAEPDSIKLSDTKTINNTTRLGAWHNWLQSVRWALRHTEARYIMTVQDDSLFHPDSRSFTESVMWPSTDTGFLSLYTASHYSVEKDSSLKSVGVNRIRTGSLWGACALVFSRSVLVDMLNHPVALNWTGVAPGNLDDKQREELVQHKLANPYLIQNVDTAIGRILNAMHLPMYSIDPSPVHHIAVHSTISHGNNTGKRNCSRCADHTTPLEDQVFPPKPPVHKVAGFSRRLVNIVEAEIGYSLTCETCLAYIYSLESQEIYSIPKLVVNLYQQLQLSNEWRKKYIGRTIRLARIEELITPLFLKN